MAQSTVVTLTTPTAAVSNGIAQAQSLSGSGNLTLNGSLVSAGVATLDLARRVYMQSGGNDSTLTWTLYGTDRYSNSITEALTGGNGATVNTLQDFLTVTTIAGSRATAGTVTAGTGAAVSSAWIKVNQLARWFSVDLLLDFQGSGGKITVEKSLAEVDPSVYAASHPGTAFPIPSAVGVPSGTQLTATTLIGDQYTCRAYRMTTVTLNTSTVTLTASQGDL